MRRHHDEVGRARPGEAGEEGRPEGAAAHRLTSYQWTAEHATRATRGARGDWHGAARWARMGEGLLRKKNESC